MILTPDSHKHIQDVMETRGLVCCAWSSAIHSCALHVYEQDSKLTLEMRVKISCEKIQLVGLHLFIYTYLHTYLYVLIFIYMLLYYTCPLCTYIFI